MRIEELDYVLPGELIATRPAEPRDSARMLVVDRHSTGDWRLTHRQVRDLPEYLSPDDVLVFNTSRVIPARFLGKRATGGRVEGLFLGEPQTGSWRVMLKSNGKLHAGDRITLDSATSGGSCHFTLIAREDDSWLVGVDPAEPAAPLLERHGATPLPPYILKARGDAHIADDCDRAWYQCVYADANHTGSVAAPTAGLHFTPELLARIDATGAERMHVVLHVGPGTFKPVTAPSLAQHVMHEEAIFVPAETVASIRKRRESTSGRVIAVGTTTVRTLESIAELEGPAEGRTRLLIAPGHPFRHVDALLTNFHLPRSTLLALVAAMIGRDRWQAVYAEAIRHRYRFYSYGDATLILP